MREGQVGGFGVMDRVAVKLKQDLVPMDDGNGAFGKMECLYSIAPDANSCGWHIGARVKKLEVKTS